MNNKRLLWLKIKYHNYYNLLFKLNELEIDSIDIKKKNNYVLIKVKYDDYLKLKKYLITYEITIYSKVGLFNYINMLKKYWFFILSFFIGLIIIIICNLFVFKVEIKNTNYKIRKIVFNELEKHGLGKMKLKKKHKEIEVIVNEILDANKDVLEWLEIKYDGLIMIVDVLEKDIIKNEYEYNNCNIVARTDSKIINMNVYKGVSLKEINDYVNANEVIISGTITHNDEVKDKVCASGKIYGEVWYRVNAEIPLYEEKIIYTGKERYNLEIKTNNNEFLIFKSRINKKKINRSNLYSLYDFKINLIKEKEIIKKIVKLDEKEAYKKGIDKIIESVKLKLQDDEEILLQKALKKSVKDSRIYLEVFIVTRENIGKRVIVEEGESF